MATKVPNRMIAFDGGNFPFRNKLINGNFDIWQRGTTFNAVADNTYTADRWDFTFDNGGTRNITRQAFTRGQTDVPNNPFYFLSVQQTVAGTSAPQKFNALVQRMEDSRLLSGKKVVLTFWAKVSTPFNSAISLQQWFGTGGSPSPQVVHYSPEFQITTTWQKFTINFELSSVSGKVLGTNPGTDFLQVAFRLPLDSTFTFDVAQVQLEEGSFATPFEQRPIGTELALCQRYYEVGEDYTSRFGSDGYTNEYFVSFKATKRAIPSMTFPYKTGQYQDPGPVNTGVTGSNVYYQYLGLAYVTGFYMVWDPVFPNQDAAPQIQYRASAEL